MLLKKELRSQRVAIYLYAPVQELWNIKSGSLCRGHEPFEVIE